METKTHTWWLVRCSDGHVRHEPFPDFEKAAIWADWGHCCTSDHTFEIERR